LEVTNSDELKNREGDVQESPFACVMSAISPDKRTGHLSNARELFQKVSEIKALDHGYAFKFEVEDSLMLKIGAFIELEKLCCPFLRFLVEVEPEGGPVWLQLTGRSGAKPFIQAELSDLLGVQIQNWSH
jgi:hypothetical protein